MTCASQAKKHEWAEKGHYLIFVKGVADKILAKYINSHASWHFEKNKRPTLFISELKHWMSYSINTVWGCSYYVLSYVMIRLHKIGVKIFLSTVPWSTNHYVSLIEINSFQTGQEQFQRIESTVYLLIVGSWINR